MNNISLTAVSLLISLQWPLEYHFLTITLILQQDHFYFQGIKRIMHVYWLDYNNNRQTSKKLFLYNYLWHLQVSPVCPVYGNP